jgi:hypothetical protein
MLYLISLLLAVPIAIFLISFVATLASLILEACFLAAGGPAPDRRRLRRERLA